MISWIKISVKVTLFWQSFFGCLVTSEVKGQFYKVIDNAAKYMYKNFRKNIITCSWIRTFLSYDFILNDFMDKNFRKVHTFLTIFFWLFSDLWGQRSFFQSCGQFCEKCVQKILYKYLDWFIYLKLSKLRFHIQWIHR